MHRECQTHAQSEGTQLLCEGREEDEAQSSSLRVCENIPAKWEWSKDQKPRSGLSVSSHLFTRSVRYITRCETHQRQLCSETWGIPLKYWKTKKQTSRWLSHDEAAVRPPCVHRLDLNWSPELLPGTDGSSREQIVGYWGKKQPCSSLLTKGSV